VRGELGLHLLVYPWWMPDALGRWLDLHDQRRRYPTPGFRGRVQRTGDRLLEVGAATLACLALVVLAGALVRVLVLAGVL
jgi:hypothetical protein